MVAVASPGVELEDSIAGVGQVLHWAGTTALTTMGSLAVWAAGGALLANTGLAGAGLALIAAVPGVGWAVAGGVLAAGWFLRDHFQGKAVQAVKRAIERSGGDVFRRVHEQASGAVRENADQLLEELNDAWRSQREQQESVLERLRADDQASREERYRREMRLRTQEVALSGAVRVVDEALQELKVGREL